MNAVTVASLLVLVLACGDATSASRDELFGPFMGAWTWRCEDKASRRTRLDPERAS